MFEEDALADKPDVTWTTNKAGLFGIIQGDKDSIEKNVAQEGDTELLTKLMSGITGFSDARFFNIIEP